MLRQGGVNDVDSFVEQFRDEAKRETAAQHYTDNQYDEDTSCRTASTSKQIYSQWEALC